MDAGQVAPALLDEQQTAAYLSLPLSTVQHLVEKGELPHLMLAGHLRFRRTDLDELIAAKVTVHWTDSQAQVAERPHIRQADRIRDYVNEHYFEPARARREHTVKITCGEVARALGLTQRLPAVVSAIGATKTEVLFSVKKMAEAGPSNGATKVFTYFLSATNDSDSSFQESTP